MSQQLPTIVSRCRSSAAAAHFRPNVPSDDLSAPPAHQRPPRSRWIRRQRWEQSEFISYGAKQVLRLGLLCRVRPASAPSDGVSTPRRSASRPVEISSSAPTTSPSVCLIASILSSSVPSTEESLPLGLGLASEDPHITHERSGQTAAPGAVRLPGPRSRPRRRSSRGQRLLGAADLRCRTRDLLHIIIGQLGAERRIILGSPQVGKLTANRLAAKMPFKCPSKAVSGSLSHRFCVRIMCMTWVELWGFEPQTSCMPCKRSTN